MQSRNVIPGVPNTSRNPFECFSEIDPYFPERNLRIAGVTRDSSGTPLGGCTVRLFDAANDVATGSVVSDGSGNFTISIPNGLSQKQTTTWYLVATDSAGLQVGATLRSLVGA
jgi:hypothetical protein